MLFFSACSIFQDSMIISYKIDIIKKLNLLVELPQLMLGLFKLLEVLQGSLKLHLN